MEQSPGSVAYGSRDDYNSEDARDTISPLPAVLRHGLAAVSMLALVSFITTTTLFAYLSYRLILWHVRPLLVKKQTIPVRPESPAVSDMNGFLVPDEHLCPQKEEEEQHNPDAAALRHCPPNQFIVLIYNLLFADIQQAVAFMLNFTWLSRDAVAVGTSACWTQGWFISTGDLASSVFISAIAAHTYMGVVRGKRLSSRAFYTSIALLWTCVYGLAILGVAVNKNGQGNGSLYVRAGAWCWINSAYQDLRLYLHYMWIFLSVTFTSLTYSVIFVHGRVHGKNKLAHSLRPLGEHYPNPDPNGPPYAPTMTPDSPVSATTDSSIKRLPPIPPSARHPTFLLYPLIYVLCTSPLAIGRISSMAGHNVSLGYFCFAGAMISSAGWLDVALYSYTRRSIVFSGEDPPGQDVGLETFAFVRTPPARRFGNVVYVAGGDSKTRRWAKWNRHTLVKAHLRTLKNSQNASIDRIRGFGMGDGEVMGMAIQCETVTTVVIQVQEKSKTSGTGDKQ